MIDSISYIIIGSVILAVITAFNDSIAERFGETNIQKIMYKICLNSWGLLFGLLTSPMVLKTDINLLSQHYPWFENALKLVTIILAIINSTASVAIFLIYVFKKEPQSEQ